MERGGDIRGKGEYRVVVGKRWSPLGEGGRH